jgi:hypothetical protein
LLIVLPAKAEAHRRVSLRSLIILSGIAFDSD